MRLVDDVDIPEIDNACRKVIESWFQIFEAHRDQKVLLKPSQLYAAYISLDLISTSAGLSFFKPEKSIVLERKFALPPVVESLKKKRELRSSKLLSLRGKS